jgi:hypothetical protein
VVEGWLEVRNDLSWLRRRPTVSDILEEMDCCDDATRVAGRSRDGYWMLAVR